MKALPFATLLLAGSLSAQSVIDSFDGAATGNRLGSSVAGIGDVNGDGIDDIVTGAIVDASFPSVSSPSMAGVARVFAGGTGTEILTLRGGSALDFFGHAVAGAGDTNGDGVPDIIVGAPLGDPSGSSSGYAQLFSGANGFLLHTFDGAAANDQLGYSVAGAGDVDGDGFDDVIVGAWLADPSGLDSGSAFVYSGDDGTVIHQFDGLLAGDNLGYSVGGAGDVDGDGLGDLIVGAFRTDANGSESGSAYVFAGVDGSLLHTFHGDGALDRLGWSVAGGGDMDGDGVDDLIVGMPGDDNTFTDAGAARVYSGATGLALYTVDGDDVGDDFGNAVACIGDANSDGYDDFVVGIFGDEDNGFDSGSIRVFSGFDGSVIHTFANSTAGDRLGWSVGGAGDFDGDGWLDVVAGARTEDPLPLTDAGRAYVYSLGLTGSPWSARIHDNSCVGGSGRLPRMRSRGAGKLGQNFDVILRSAAPNTTSTLFFGLPVNFPLDALGLAPCRLYVDPWLEIPLPTDTTGSHTFTLPITNDAGLIGFPFEFQWITLDLAAPYTLPLTLTDALTLTIGA